MENKLRAPRRLPTREVASGVGVETITPYYLYNFLALGAIIILGLYVEVRELGEPIVHLDNFSVDPRNPS